MRSLDGEQPVLDLKGSHQRLGPFPVVLVADRRPVQANPAARQVDVVSVAHDGEGVEAHPLRPRRRHRAPFVVGQGAVLGRQAQRRVDHVHPKARTEPVHLVQLVGQLHCRRARHGAAYDLRAGSHIPVAVAGTEEVSAQPPGLAPLGGLPDHGSPPSSTARRDRTSRRSSSRTGSSTVVSAPWWSSFTAWLRFPSPWPSAIHAVA